MIYKIFQRIYEKGGRREDPRIQANFLQNEFQKLLPDINDDILINNLDLCKNKKANSL